MRLVATIVGLGLMLLAASQAPAAADTQEASTTGPVAQHQGPDFKLTLPPQFEAVKPKPQHLAAFCSYDDGRPRIYVFLQKVDGELSRRLYTRDDMKGRKSDGGSIDDVYTEKWQGMDVNVFVLRLDRAEGVLIQRNIAVPLKGDSLNVIILGPKDADDDMKLLARTLLENLQGESNWAPEGGTKGLGWLKYAAPAIFMVGLVIIILTLKRYQAVQRRKAAAEEAALQQALAAARPARPAAPPTDPRRQPPGGNARVK